MPDVSRSWAARHHAIVLSLKTPAVLRAIGDLELHCRPRLPPLDNPDDEQDQGRISGVGRKHTPRRLGRELDLALAVLWSSTGIPLGKDPNAFRSSAMPYVQDLSRLLLAIDDFKSLKTLQRSSGSFVEVVRCKLNRQLYVLKTIVKGFAKRNAAIQSPTCETIFLTKRQSSATPVSDPETRRITPELFAAFQTQGSVHLVMEYVPSGDLSELLIAASRCGPEYPGRAATGLLVEDWIFRYAADMILAVGWVHSKGYAHRDIKPGNFLLDRSGHLKLCDFSSAAPFSRFQESSPTGEGGCVWTRKVLRFYCSLPTGTCDYLSPELLEAEEERIARRQLSFRSFDESDLPCLRTSEPEAKPDDVDPGPYGPEMDWWSLGIMLYEMRYGVLPFFSDQMQATYELIRNHRETLKFDPAVECSQPLMGLMQGLIQDPLRRIGRNGTHELQEHSFFRGVDWSQEWPLAPPFVPNVHPANSGPASAAIEPELSVLHSPHVHLPGDMVGSGSLSAVDTLPDFSALYAGDLDDFPAFTDSRDFEQPGMTTSRSFDQAGWAAEITGAAAGSGSLQTVYGLPRSSSSPAIVDASASPSPSPCRAVGMESLPSSNSRLGIMSTPRWSDCDLALVGFSYVPDAEAFQTLSPPPPPLAQKEFGAEKTTLELLSSAPSMASVHSDVGASPALWIGSEPMASTPQERGAQKMKRQEGGPSGLPSLPSFLPSPAAPWSANRSVEAAPASAALPEEGPPLRRMHSFVTPARKASYICLADQFAGTVANQQQQTNPRSTIAGPSTESPAVPQSPYPFPLVASESMPSAAKRRAGPLRRNDLARARSATPGAGSVGSDSRYSGGSNAVREVSESQAWDEMMAAVQKSVRRKQTEGDTPVSTWPRRHPQSPFFSRPGVSTITGADRRKLTDTPDARAAAWNRPTLALPSLATIAPSPEGKGEPRGGGDGIGTGQEESDRNAEGGGASGRTLLCAPAAWDEEPTLEVQRELSTAGRLLAPQAMRIYTSDSDDSLSDVEHNAPLGLRHKRSARQLLIKAQERSTPTKPRRTQSPSLTEVHASRLDGGVCRSSSPLSTVEGAEQAASSPRDLSIEVTPLDGALADIAAAAAAAAARARPISTLSLYGRQGASSPASCSVGNLSTSSGHGSSSCAGSLAKMPVLGAVTFLDPNGSGNAGRAEGRAGESGLRPDSLLAREVRRKSSRDMLSDYRKGIGRPSSMGAVKVGEGKISVGQEDAFLEATSCIGATAAGVGERRERRFSSAISAEPLQRDSLFTGAVNPPTGSERRRRASESVATRGPHEGFPTTSGRRVSQQKRTSTLMNQAPLREDPHELSSPSSDDEDATVRTHKQPDARGDSLQGRGKGRGRHLRRTASKADLAKPGQVQLAGDQALRNANRGLAGNNDLRTESPSRPLRESTNRLTRRISSLMIGGMKPFPRRTVTAPLATRSASSAASSASDTKIDRHEDVPIGAGNKADDAPVQRSKSAEDVCSLTSNSAKGQGGRQRRESAAISRKCASEASVRASGGLERGQTDSSTTDEVKVAGGQEDKEQSWTRAAAKGTGEGEVHRPAAGGDVSLLTGLQSCHSALQGSLMELEVRLAVIKRRLEK